MKFRITLALLALMLPLPALAAPMPHWQIDPAHSSLAFSGTQQGAGFDGKFTDFTGTIDFDPASPQTGHGTITVKTASATTNSSDRDQYISKNAWFGSQQFPDATYAITSIEKTSQDQYVAHGNLTIRDKSLPLNLPFTLKIDPAGTAHVTGQARLNRLDFGVGQGEWKDTSMVGDAITVKVDAVATKQ